MCIERDFTDRRYNSPWIKHLLNQHRDTIQKIENERRKELKQGALNEQTK